MADWPMTDPYQLPSGLWGWKCVFCTPGVAGYADERSALDALRHHLHRMHRWKDGR